MGTTMSLYVGVIKISPFLGDAWLGIDKYFAIVAVLIQKIW